MRWITIYFFKIILLLNDKVSEKIIELGLDSLDLDLDLV